jgi:hypothetical protein
LAAGAAFTVDTIVWLPQPDGKNVQREVSATYP